MIKECYKTIQINPNAIRRIKRNQKNISNFLNLTKELIRNNWLLFFLTCVMIIGIALGAILTKNADSNLLKSLNFLFVNNYTARVSQPVIDTFFASLVSSFTFILITILMGLSMWGILTIPIVPLFRGLGVGISSGYLYLSFGWQGILFNLLVVLPGLFLSSIALIISSKEAVRFSAILATLGFPNNKKLIRKIPDIKIYFIKNSKSFLLMGAGAFVDMLFSWCFSGLFNL